ASAGEANYTPGPHTRQHLLREKSGKFIAKLPSSRQAHDPTEDMNKGYFNLPVKKRMPARLPPRRRTAKQTGRRCRRPVSMLFSSVIDSQAVAMDDRC
ncbi:hypothetical protein, partial [Pseudogulbenkiania ferrooxidans]|uniref:hypothetical protein n=1 Tax=Pseudogulbenkiania ferrooxidans TaxID=549169 RepID=UPI0025709CB9